MTPLDESDALIGRLFEEGADVVAIAHASYHTFLQACAGPAAVQEQLLRAIVHEARETAFGREHDFASIDSLARYREVVPPHSYDQLRPYIDRVVAGEADVLFPGRPEFYAQTSGTTGVPKRVPFSMALPREYASFFFPSFGAIDIAHPGSFAGRQMIFARFIEGHAGDVPFGSANGYVRNLHDTLFRDLRVPAAVFDEPTMNIRYYAMFLYILSQPLVCLAALNPSTLLTFIDKLDAFGAQLAADLAAGTWSHGPAGIDRVMASVPPFTAAPETARRITESLARSGRVDLEFVCPELRLITLWRGGNAKHYQRQVRARLPNVELRAEVSGSSEAGLLVPLDAHTDGGVPSLFSTVIEFLPIDHEPGDGVTHGIEELKPDQGYRFIVTNRRGMYRLVMDDVFYLERTIDRAPVLRFSHRHGLTSSLTGEKLTEWHVLEAVQAASAATKIDLLDFQLRPEWGEPPRYVLLAELDRPVDMQPFLAALEAKLSEVNIEYAAKRSSQRLAPPQLVVLPRGELRRWLEASLAASGRSDAQAKIARLHRELLTLDASLARTEL
ncbi:MAG TPA: GH3 auxin-responsive promoter family protein [Kofleriaceae bacterium]|jgi:hypothetical protein